MNNIIKDRTAKGWPFPASSQGASPSGLARPLRARRPLSPHPPLSPGIKTCTARCFPTSLHLSSTSPCRPLAPSRIARVCAPILLPSWCLPTIADPCAWTFGWGIVPVAFPLGITSLQLSPWPSLNLPTLFYDWSQWYRRPIWFAALCILLCPAGQLEMTLFQGILDHLFARPCRSGLSCPLPSLARHRFTTAQLICNPATVLAENFQLAKSWPLSRGSTQLMKGMPHPS